MDKLPPAYRPGFVLFANGFRCFFLGAALLAATSIGIWALFFSAVLDPGLHYYPPMIWHMHEMIFGYAGAVMAGFLLTAVTNWTGRATLNGASLFVLFMLWLAAHLLPYIAIAPGWLIAALNVAFFIYLAIAIAIPIIASNNYRNLFVIGIIITLGICNALVHSELLGLSVYGSSALNATGVSNAGSTAMSTALYLQLLLITIMAGRVFPMFSTGGVVDRYQPKSYKYLELVALASFALFASSSILQFAAPVQLVIMLFAVVLHSVRVAAWYNRQIFSVPLVWVLHIGYYFLIVGMLLTGLSGYFPETRVVGLHAMLMGGLGMITLGMMARVSLGHSGRDIHQPPRVVSLVFLLVVAATLCRVFIPLILSQFYLTAIQIGGVLWSIAFMLFTVYYLPFWLRPRVDGAAG